jgi:hypothetical protein
MESEIATRTYHPKDRKTWNEVGPAVHLFFPESMAYETTTADASPGQTLFLASSSCIMCNNQPASDMNDNQFLVRSHTQSAKEKDRGGDKEKVTDKSSANQKKLQEEVRDDASTSGQKTAGFLRIKPQSAHETEYVTLSPKCTISERMSNNAPSPKGCQILDTAGIGMIVERTAKRGVVVNAVGVKQNFS